jgi:DNA-directed RNA polymerase subunit H (RpoH/RPB5)
MSSSYNPLLPKLYKSRKVILEILRSRGYDVEDHLNFNINNIQSMYSNAQMDMLLVNPDSGKKIFVKYHLSKKLGPKNLYEIIDDLYDMDEILKPEDTLLIISKDRVNDTHKKLLTEFYDKDKKFINIFNLNDYLFNILENDLVPPHIILNENEKNVVMKEYNMKTDYEFPQISRFDPAALAIGIKPNEVCEITRITPTAISSKYWRICV